MVLAANSVIALFHPLAAALVLALLLTVLAWRLQPARRTREEEAAVEAAIDEVWPREGSRRDR